MVPARRSAVTGVLIGLLACPAVAGCGGSSGNASGAGSTVQQPSTSIAATAISTGLPQSPSAAAGSFTAGSGPASAAPSTISIPPYLCTGTDVAQNAADAYMGALSAGDLKQASACVLPGSVPASVTRSLIASTGQTAVYLPRDGADGPKVFGYRGNGKLIDVTITKESDGRFWVTAVAVRSG